MAVAGTSASAEATDAPDEPAQQRRFTVTPMFSATVTLSDNVDLAGSNRRSDFVSQLSPGVQISSNSGRIKGFFNYSLNALIYARERRNDDIQHALNAAATVEAVENWAFVDIAGIISRQAVSAFGTQSSDNTSVNANRTAVSTYTIAPFIRGQFGDAASYEARVNYTDSSNGADVVSKAAKSTEALVRLGGTSAQRIIGWSLDLSRQSFDYDTAGSAHTDRLRGSLSYAVTPDLNLSMIGGRESENVQGPNTRSRGTGGWGVNWTPTERTHLSAISEQRFFGNSHSVSLEHRTPRTVWKYSDSRELTTGFDQLRLRSLGTAYDLVFTQFASLEPDPVARGALVNAFLQSNGISPNTVVLGGSLASATLVQRRQDLSFAWIGLRDTLTVAASTSSGERADRAIVVSDDFANGNQVRQRGLSVGLAHRLTPVSSFNITASTQNSSASVDTRTSKLRSLLLTWTDRVGANTSGSLSLRHQRGDNASQTYNESALIATLSLQF